MPKAPEYTKCVTPQAFSSEDFLKWAGNGLVVASIYSIIFLMATQAAATGWLPWTAFGTIAGLLMAVTTFAQFAHWWLYGRLICLGHEYCVIGMVVSVEPPQKKSGLERFDSDYSFNLLLPPHQIGETAQDIEARGGLMAKLIREQPATKAKLLPFNGYDTVGPNCPQDRRTEVLHCEIEGAGMKILYDTLRALIVILSVAAVASWLCAVPVIGWIACIVAAVLAAGALLTALIGLTIAKDDAAKPSDVNPALGGDLHWGCGGKGADVLVVVGEWVYDSLLIGHSNPGWNEIHPVRHCQKDHTWSGSWPADIDDRRDRWCAAIAAARSPQSQSTQAQPENQWTIHPLLDGCQPRADDNDEPIVV